MAVDLAELTAKSRGICFGRPREHYCRWEDLGGSRRIVTYSRVEVVEPVAGEVEAEYQLRTLGGTMGDVGQLVHGEAVLRVGEDCLLFTRRDRDGADVVTARAQGHYPLQADDHGELRLRRSPRVAHLVDPEKSAAKVLVGRTMGEARQLVLDALARGK